MKLTNYLRDAFIHAAMQDVPKPDYDALKKEAQDLLFAAMHRDAQKVFKTAPNALVQIHVNGLSDRAPAKLLAGDVAKPYEIIKPVLEKSAAREGVRAKLRQVAYGCTTLKQLQTALPDLVKYMPSAANPTGVNLPVVANVVDDMKKLGWNPDPVGA